MINLRRNIQNGLGLSLKIPGVTYRQSSSDLGYQYWQRSIVPTLHFQKSLPRLPIPELPKTLERYLRAQKPLLNSQDYSRTEKYAQSFLSNEGATLQKELQEQDKQNKHTSYISEPWFNMYLSDRTPLPINYNPCLIFINRGNNFHDTQPIKTTDLIISSLRFYKSLSDNLLEPEVFHLNPKKSDTPFFRSFTSLLPSSISWYGAYLLKAYPLDMSQYSSLFNSTRIPEIGKDHLYQDKTQRHIVVLRNGHFYTFDALDEFGDIKNPDFILACIKYILKDDSKPAEHPIGILTSTERNKWAEARKHLEKIGNQDSLNKIDTALFAVSLDNVVVQKPADIVRWFLHADGINRWFDKSFTLISTANGFAGLNFEHSWGDGVAVLRYFTDIFKDSAENPWIDITTEPATLTSLDLPKKLNFVIDDKIKHDIQEAKQAYDKVCSSLGVRDVIRGIGRTFCKEHKVSPDALMQLAFQLAYYNLAKKTTATYESCSTAAFKHGRTETVRPCTTETLKFCEAITSGHVDNEELRNMISRCSTVHSELVKNAAMGQGFDRHLFALRKLAEKKSEKLPEIFTDPSYAFINHNVLSTSTLSSDLVLGGGFGPVVPDGYGIAYMIRKDTCGTVITNYRTKTNGAAFATSLEKSLETIKAVLTKQ